MSNERGRGNGKKIYNSQPMEGASKDWRYDESNLDEDLSWSTVVQGKKNPQPPQSPPLTPTNY